ncbi:C1 family peptidase [Mycobacterium riyadhense]|nr:C1 family peptidase [Mycobacterium riyadhense]
MTARIDRRSMLAFSAVGALTAALPSCRSAQPLQDSEEPNHSDQEPVELDDYGYDPDVPETATPETPLRRGKVPSAASVRTDWLPPVGRQTMPNCFVWGSVYGLATFYAARKSGVPPTSPARQAGPDYAYIRYEIANKMKEENCQGGQITRCLNWLRSNGGTPSLAAAPNHGRRPSKPSCGVNWSVYGSQTIPPEPSFLIPEYKATKITGPDGLTNLRTVIASGMPIDFGTSLYTDFMHYRGRPSPYVGNKQFVKNKGGKQAGHVMLIVAYDDDYTKSSGAVRIQNSWGTRWGEKGFAWMAYDTLESLAQGYGVYVPESA